HHLNPSCLPSFPTRRSSDLNLTLPVGAPILSRIAMTRDDAEANMATRRRWQALWALANLGDNLKRFERLMRQDIVLSELKAEARSEEHTSELQSRGHLVCRL